MVVFGVWSGGATLFGQETLRLRCSSTGVPRATSSGSLSAGCPWCDVDVDVDCVVWRDGYVVVCVVWWCGVWWLRCVVWGGGVVCDGYVVCVLWCV